AYHSMSLSATRPVRRPLSFPTRRSSDLALVRAPADLYGPADAGQSGGAVQVYDAQVDRDAGGHRHSRHPGRLGHRKLVRLLRIRSEEHTSELQSRGHLVCRLLLEKKKMT